jgi:hypothetical protein
MSSLLLMNNNSSFMEKAASTFVNFVEKNPNAIEKMVSIGGKYCGRKNSFGPRKLIDSFKKGKRSRTKLSEKEVKELMSNYYDKFNRRNGISVEQNLKYLSPALRKYRFGTKKSNKKRSLKKSNKKGKGTMKLLYEKMYGNNQSRQIVRF